MLNMMGSWVVWAQKWQSGIVKCLTNCPFGAAAPTWVRGAFAQSFWQNSNTDKNNDKNTSAITNTVYEIQTGPVQLVYHGGVYVHCPVMVGLLARGPMVWGKGWTGLEKAAVRWSQLTTPCSRYKYKSVWKTLQILNKLAIGQQCTRRTSICLPFRHQNQVLKHLKLLKDLNVPFRLGREMRVEWIHLVTKLHLERQTTGQERGAICMLCLQRALKIVSSVP